MSVAKILSRLRGAILVVGIVAPFTAIGKDATTDKNVWTNPVMAPVRVLIDGLNSGDVASVEEVLAPDATIADEIPPYYWSGPGAYARLMKDFADVVKQQGIEEFVVNLESVDQIQATDERAYVALSADVVSRAKGVTSHGPGRFVIALARAAGDWKIVHWSWVLNPERPKAEVTP